MKKLLSLPPNLVGCFNDITGYDGKEWFCTNDPVGRKLGSGGGSTWLLKACYDKLGGGLSFNDWLSADSGCCCMPADRAAVYRLMHHRARF